jgi:hypothetical protein
MRRDLLQSAAVLASLEIGYGGAFSVLGFAALGAGHGNGVIVLVGSSPFSISPVKAWLKGLQLPGQSAILVLLAMPLVIWPLIGGLLGIRSRYARVAFLLLIFSHYVGLAAVFTSTTADGWRHVYKVIEVVIAAGLWYLIGQVFIWVVFCYLLRHREDQSEVCTTTTSVSKP